jgi:ABC-type oligopeptide transport system substrate-binding subunit
VNARTRILVALCAAALAATLLMWDSAAAGADYSDHGEPQTSTVASTHPQTYTPSGGLARTGADLTPVWQLGGVLFVAGLAVVLLASRKRTGVRT